MTVAIKLAWLLAVLSLCAGKIEWGLLGGREEHVQAVHEAQAGPKQAFAAWVDHFQKAYKEDLEEYERRFSIWLDNLQFIQHYNARHESHWLGLNKMADWTFEEYRQHSLGYRPDLRNGLSTTPTPFMYEDTVPPETIDWRKNGTVSPVKNQAQCGSCWAFSTTGSIEGINAIFTGKLVSLSEQELVDCDVSRDHGCHGGLMDFAFTFVIQNGGLDTEEDYKYVAEEEKCAVRKEHRKVVTIDGYEDVPPNNERALKKAVAGQPVSVAIEADQRSFQLYQGGIFDGECGTALDHGVLVVGYGTEDGQDYWIVKNSWGAQWGDRGYIRLQRNVANSVGQCGIAMQASYPVKKTPNPPEPPPVPPSPPRPTPPPPGPVACDASVACPAGSTCCCQRDFFGYCLSWACCPLVNAVCCDDQQHCCPHNLPVCDTAAGRCLAGQGIGFDDSEPWSTKFPATKIHDSRDWLPKLPWSSSEAVTNATGAVMAS